VICADAFDAAANGELQDGSISSTLRCHGALRGPGTALAVLREAASADILTFVPNLRGVNWLMQRPAYLRILICTSGWAGVLARVHAEAGLSTSRRGASASTTDG
jgi:hypothetical protein